MMFKDILSTFLEFFIVYVLFIIAFALGFYTEMRNAVSIIGLFGYCKGGTSFSPHFSNSSLSMYCLSLHLLWDSTQK